jgi:hypothetical protein
MARRATRVLTRPPRQPGAFRRRPGYRKAGMISAPKPRISAPGSSTIE